MTKVSKAQERADRIVNALVDGAIQAANKYRNAGIPIDADDCAKLIGVSVAQARDALNLATEQGMLEPGGYMGSRRTNWSPSPLAFAVRIRAMQDTMHAAFDAIPTPRPTEIAELFARYCDERSENRFAERRMRERTAFDNMIREMAAESRNRRD